MAALLVLYLRASGLTVQLAPALLCQCLPALLALCQDLLALCRDNHLAVEQAVAHGICCPPVLPCLPAQLHTDACHPLGVLQPNG